MEFEWDVAKAATNYRKHGVRFSESTAVFYDDDAITINDDDSDPNEQRLVSIGRDMRGRVLVVVYTYREAKVRIISARVAGLQERTQYEDIR